MNKTAVVTMSFINNYSTYRFVRLRNPKRFDNKSRRVIKRFPIFLAQRFQWVPKWLPLAYMNGPGLRKVRQFLRNAFLPVTPAKPPVTKPNSLWGSGSAAHAHSAETASVRNQERDTGRIVFTDPVIPVLGQ